MRESDPTKFIFSESLPLGKEIYELVDIQREKISAIYKSNDKYLRIGSAEKIQRDLFVHKKMAGFGFPVPRLIEEGMLEKASYFIEESVGLKSFGHIFKGEIEQGGSIKEKTFDAFIDVCGQLASAQMKTATQEKDWSAFQVAIHLDTVCDELPEEKEKILMTYQGVERRLSAFPFVLTHGDFTPFNIYPKGIIDLENSFMGPAGYDLGGLVEHLYWFPESNAYEFYQLYHFTSQQKIRFIDSIDKIYLSNNLPKLSDHLMDFNFVRGLWFVASMSRTPKLQQFRYTELKKLIRETPQ